MRPVNNIVERFIPSTLVFSIVLTSVDAILALILTGTDPADLILHWGEGLADCWPARAPTRATSAGYTSDRFPPPDHVIRSGDSQLRGSQPAGARGMSWGPGNGQRGFAARSGEPGSRRLPLGMMLVAHPPTVSAVLRG